MKTYLVGGAVRDMLLGLPIKDRDWVVVGATPQEMLDAGFKQVGADFPVFLHPTTKEEYALARTERKTGAGYHGFETTFDPTVTIEDDLLRRDLTINAMAIEADQVMHYKMTLDAALLVDPFNGATDLEEGLLRHVSPAFAEDPVRILRVARFAARYEFTVHDSTAILMHDMVENGEVDSLTPERVWAEFEKAMGEPKPALFFEVLEGVGALYKVLPMFNVAQDTVLDVCEEFTCEMATRHKLAAVLVVAAIHTNGNDHENKRAQMFTDARVPNDVRKLVEQVYTLAERRGKGHMTAIDWLEKLKTLGWYREPEMAAEVGRVLPPYQWAVPRWEMLVEALHATEDVAFADLTDEQKGRLRGPEVGAAIDALRLKKLKKLEFKVKLSG